MAKDKTGTAAGTEAVTGASEGQAGADAGKEAKTRKRAQSKYILGRQLPKVEGEAGSRFEVVAAGASTKALELEAAKMDDGKYMIANIKRVLEVKIETAKTVKRIK